MFINEISDEAYLDFIGKFGSQPNAVVLYLSKNTDEVYPLFPASELFGYVSISGEIPEDHDVAVIYEQSLDRYFIPIRQENNGRVRIRYVRNNGRQNSGAQSLVYGDIDSLQRNTIYAFFEYNEASKNYSISVRSH